MRKLLLASILCASAHALFAQYNYRKLSFGGGIGATTNMGDLPQPAINKTFLIEGDYMFTPFLKAGVQFQMGNLSGKGKNTDQRNYNNQYRSYILLSKLYLGQFMPRTYLYYGTKSKLNKALAGLYSGYGVGIISSNLKTVYRNPNLSNTWGSDKSKEIIIPIAVGIDNSGFNPKTIVGISVQGHFALSDQLDGYHVANSKNDFYSTVSFTLKFPFGRQGIF